MLKAFFCNIKCILIHLLTEFVKAILFLCNRQTQKRGNTSRRELRPFIRYRFCVVHLYLLSPHQPLRYLSYEISSFVFFFILSQCTLFKDSDDN